MQVTLICTNKATAGGGTLSAVATVVFTTPDGKTVFSQQTTPEDADASFALNHSYVVTLTAVENG